MRVLLRRVDGGYELFIPDELAAGAGLSDTVPVEADLMAEMILVKQPAFVSAARQAQYDKITPETLHGEDDWGLPVGRERVAE
jgi:antitoxin component of MazEF toxin-antitoxin module